MHDENSSGLIFTNEPLRGFYFSEEKLVLERKPMGADTG